jgi:hypothetical protein
MPIQVEIYTAEGVAVGVVARAGHLRDALESSGPVTLERATWYPLDGRAGQPAGELILQPDDIHLAFADEADDGPVHAQWHDVGLDVGPYRIRGQIPTMPGFDPGRALARPTGEFVPLRDVTIGLLGEPDNESIVKRMVLVNRYVVDRVTADFMLGFFFPGAEMITTGGRERQAAGAEGNVPAPASPTRTVPEAQTLS